MNNDLLFGYFLSFSTYVTLLDAPLSDDLNLAVAYFDPNTQPGDYDSFGDDQGYALAGEYKRELPGGLDGSISSIFLYTNNDALAFDSPRLVPGLILFELPKI